MDSGDFSSDDYSADPNFSPEKLKRSYRYQVFDETESIRKKRQTFKKTASLSDIFASTSTSTSIESSPTERPCNFENTEERVRGQNFELEGRGWSWQQEQDGEDSPTNGQDIEFRTAKIADPESSRIFSGRYFKIIKELKTTEFHRKRSGVLVECCICHTKLQGSKQVTSNLIRHLRQKHAEDFSAYKNSKVVNHMPISRQKEFQNLTIKFIASNMLPISIVEDQSLRNMMHFANAGLKIMSRPTAVKKIDEIFSSMIEKMKCYISKNKYFCTTADVWSTKHRSFFGYTCHWLDVSYQRKSMALACKRFPGSHSYNRINDMIIQIHTQFGLNCSNIVATVTDNGSNFLKAFKEFGIEEALKHYHDDDIDDGDASDNEEIEFQNTVFENCLPKHIKCATHTLNLVASTDLIRILKQSPSIYDKHKSIIHKCTNLWSKVNRPKSSEQIVSVLGCQLKYPVVTRWNSLFAAIKDITAHKSNINELCSRLEVSKFFEADIDYLEDYVNLLRPVADALDFLQGENGMFYGYLLPTLATIRNKYRKFHTHNTLKTLNLEIVTMFEDSLVKRFQKYFDLTREVNDAIVASVLCPTVKLKWISALNPSYNDGKLTDISTFVKKKIQAEYSTNSESPEKKQQNKSIGYSYFDFSITDDDELLEPCSSSDANHSVETEYFAYLANTSTSIEMLDQYPTIKQAFLKYNTPLPSSAAVERLFSFAGMISAPRRGSLSDSNFEKLLLLKVNNIDVDEM